MWSLEQSIGYLEVLRFDDGVAEDIDLAMTDLKDTVALIVDLRRNEGGNLSYLRLTSYLIGGPSFALALLTRQFLNRFDRAPEILPDETLRHLPVECAAYTTRAILDALKRNQGGAAFYTEDVGSVYQHEVMVLISPSTASAAEGFVWSLRDRPRTTLVGRPTAGAVAGSESFDLPGGWKLFVPTHAAWGPDRKLYRDMKFSPGIPVAASRANLCAGVDAELNAALRALRDKFAKR